MITFISTLKSQFEASAAKIAAEQAPTTFFEKFHVLSLDFRTPIIASILYVLAVSYFSKLNRERGSTSSGPGASSGKRTSSRSKSASAAAEAAIVKEESRFTPFKCLVIAHNVFLCLYSATVFLSALPLIVRPYFDSPILEAYCDVQKKTFGSGVHFWIWNFYISKYYELLDTAILLLKGKPSSFLQTFHHSGSIMGMWIMTTTHAPAGWIFVLFNSFIHTIMYFYYILTCLGYRPTWKRILTTMQIVQFCVGNPLGLIYAILPGCLPLENIPPENIVGKLLGSQLRSLYACLFINTFFISSLVILFTDFSRKTYGAKDGETGVAIANKKARSPKVASSEVKAVKSIKAISAKETKKTAATKAAAKETAATKTAKAAKETTVKKSPKAKTVAAVPEEPTKKTAKTSKKESPVLVEAPVTTRRSRRS